MKQEKKNGKIILKYEKPGVYCRYKYFESLPKYPIDKPIIGMSSKYQGSYEEQ